MRDCNVYGNDGDSRSVVNVGACRSVRDVDSGLPPGSRRIIIGCTSVYQRGIFRSENAHGINVEVSSRT